MDAAMHELSDPQIEWLILADRAEAINGKVYLMGGAWDQTTVPDINQPILLSFALCLLVPWHATNRVFTIHISLTDEDNNSVGVAMDGTLTVGRPPLATPGQPQRALLAVPALPVQLHRYGGYVLTASIAGYGSKRVQFWAINPANPLPISGQSPQSSTDA